MKVYLAITNPKFIEDLIPNADILSSYWYCKKDKVITDMIPRMRNFILDSGIFTMINSGARVDIDKYLDEYAEYIRGNNIRQYIELDVDQIYGVEKTRKIRDKLESKVGWQSIPVWHSIRGKDVYIQDCKEYSYIALGYFLTEGLPAELTLRYAKTFVDTAHKYDTRIHGLGFTQTTQLSKIPFDSVDSSTWAASRRYGMTCQFCPKEGVIKNISKPKNLRMKVSFFLNTIP